GLERESRAAHRAGGPQARAGARAGEGHELPRPPEALTLGAGGGLATAVPPALHRGDVRRAARARGLDLDRARILALEPRAGTDEGDGRAPRRPRHHLRRARYAARARRADDDRLRRPAPDPPPARRRGRGGAHPAPAPVLALPAAGRPLARLRVRRAEGAARARDEAR